MLMFLLLWFQASEEVNAEPKCQGVQPCQSPHDHGETAVLVIYSNTMIVVYQYLTSLALVL